MTTRIAMDCLKCGHCSSVSEDKLPYFGLEPNSYLVTLSKRLGLQRVRQSERADVPVCRRRGADTGSPGLREQGLAESS